MLTSRREFIKIMGATSSVLLVPSILNGEEHSNEYFKTDVLNSWNGHNVDEEDIRIKVLSYAILAANPHNKQPWVIDLKGTNSFDLYVDRRRLLPQTDPFYRQIHIGQGTFLENFSIASTYFGYKAIINYFPQGEYSNQVLENKPVASVELIKEDGIKQDKLFNIILDRHSNKSEYNDKVISSEKLEKLQVEMNEVLENGYRLNLTTNQSEIKILKDIAVDAMRIESLNNKRDLETIEMFRFNNEEIEKYRDGFGLAQSGTTGIVKWMIETFIMSRESYTKNPHEFGIESISIAQKQIDSSNTFGWLTTNGNTRMDQLKIGRAYERLNLIVNSLGLAIHPMSQVIEEYPDMLELQKKFLTQTKIQAHETGQMFFRIGYANKTEHSPRREIKDMMKS